MAWSALCSGILLFGWVKCFNGVYLYILFYMLKTANNPIVWDCQPAASLWVASHTLQRYVQNEF